jgi:hypothetical protein
LKVRTRGAQWLAVERLPDWDLLFVVASELHSGIEGLWQGLDASHPLHTHPSAGAAAQALVKIHRELDTLVGQLIHTAGDAAIIAFNMGGMGPNSCDVQSMVLLAELLYRNSFGQELLSLPPAWTAAPNTLPILDEHDSWEAACASWIPDPAEAVAANPIRLAARHWLQLISHRLKNRAPAALRCFLSRPPKIEHGVDWMPSYQYRRHWPRMSAFALPSFSHGRIRINLCGRERHGMVHLSHYEEVCRSLETLLSECRDPRTGEPAVATTLRASNPNPLALESSDADIWVRWSNVAVALEHPRLGLIGPVPLHRTGGHSGSHGVVYLAAPGVEPGERGKRSSFDVAPTIAQLVGAQFAPQLSGKSLLRQTDMR